MTEEGPPPLEALQKEEVMDQGLLTKANLRKGSAEKMGKLIHISSMADRDILVVNWQKFKFLLQTATAYAAKMSPEEEAVYQMGCGGG